MDSKKIVKIVVVVIILGIIYSFVKPLIEENPKDITIIPGDLINHIGTTGKSLPDWKRTIENYEEGEPLPKDGFANGFKRDELVEKWGEPKKKITRIDKNDLESVYPYVEYWVIEDVYEGKYAGQKEPMYVSIAYDKMDIVHESYCDKEMKTFYKNNNTTQKDK